MKPEFILTFIMAKNLLFIIRSNSTLRYTYFMRCMPAERDSGVCWKRSYSPVNRIRSMILEKFSKSHVTVYVFSAL
jgi:hypothetical protein